MKIISLCIETLLEATKLTVFRNWQNRAIYILALLGFLVFFHFNYLNYSNYFNALRIGKIIKEKQIFFLNGVFNVQ